MLLRDSLTADELKYCGYMTYRTYQKLGTQAGYVAGANILDIGKISVDSALIVNDVRILADAFRCVHNELVIHDDLKADGIHPDGSFSEWHSLTLDVVCSSQFLIRSPRPA